jgi:hypothetical protein
MYPNLYLVHTNKGQMWQGITHVKHYIPPMSEDQKKIQKRIRSKLYQHMYYVDHKSENVEPKRPRGPLELGRFQEQDSQYVQPEPSIILNNIIPPLGLVNLPQPKSDTMMARPASEPIRTVRLVIRDGKQLASSSSNIEGGRSFESPSFMKGLREDSGPYNGPSPENVPHTPSHILSSELNISTDPQTTLVGSCGSVVNPDDKNPPVIKSQMPTRKLKLPVVPIRSALVSPKLQPSSQTIIMPDIITMLPIIPALSSSGAPTPRKSSVNEGLSILEPVLSNLSGGSTPRKSFVHEELSVGQSVISTADSIVVTPMSQPPESPSFMNGFRGDDANVDRPIGRGPLHGPSPVSKTGKRSLTTGDKVTKSKKSKKSLSSIEVYFQKKVEHQTILDANLRSYDQMIERSYDLMMENGGVGPQDNGQTTKLANQILKLIREWGNVAQPEPSVTTLSQRYDPQLADQVDKEYDDFTQWYNDEDDRLTLGYTDDRLYFFLEDHDWSHKICDKKIQKLQKRRDQVDSLYEIWANGGLPR